MDNITDETTDAKLVLANGSAATEPWCATSFCLHMYFKCMCASNCTSDEDLREHLLISIKMGCMPRQWGVSPLND